MIYPCPKCGKKTKILHSPRKYKPGGLIRRRGCTDPECKQPEFEMLEIERNTVEAIVERRFKQRYSALLDRLQKVIDDLARH